MSHRLDRLELEIHTADGALARPLLDRLSRLHHQILQEVLGRVMDELSPAGASHRLDRLEIELGEIPADRLERELPQRLERALREALPPLLRNPGESGGAEAPERHPPVAPMVAEDPSSAPSPAASPAPDNRRPPPASSSNPPPPPAPAPTTLPLPRHLELLAAFAASGTLPWWAPRDQSRLIPEALEAALALPTEVAAPLWRRLAPLGAAAPRLLAAADPSQRPLVLRALREAGRPAPDTADAADAASDAPDGAALPPVPPSQGAARENGGPPSDSSGAFQDTPLPRHLELLAAFAASGTLPWWAPRDQSRLIPEALEAALALPTEVAAPLWRRLAPLGAAAPRLLAAADPSQRPLVLRALREAGRPAPDTADAADAASDAPDGAALPPVPPSQGAARENGGPPSDSSGAFQDTPLPRHLELLAAFAASGTLPSIPPHRPADEALTLDGAGLVLLYPFLTTLFERLALLTPKRTFAGASERARAVALLGFLVDGDPRPPEWRLTLAKLFCGVPLEELCALDDPLGEPDRAEAEGLLRAAQAHGEGLLGEDIGPLRERWLQRAGLLSWRPGTWLLVVERREGDEALDDLPWSWDWIRLPWMGELVRVVW